MIHSMCCAVGWPGRMPGTEPVEHAYPGWALMAIAEADYGDPRTRAFAKRLLREALAPLVGERPLRSREYFRRPLAPLSWDPDTRR